MSKHITLIVKMPVLNGVLITQYKDYVREAVECYSGSFAPGDAFFGTLHGKVKVVSPRKEPKKKEANRFVPMPTNVEQASLMQMVGYQWLKDNAPDRLSPILSVLNCLTDEEREKLFDNFCTHCGSKDPKCQCRNNKMTSSWISVKSRLPSESDGEVFVRFTNGEIGTAWASYWYGASDAFAGWKSLYPDEDRDVEYWMIPPPVPEVEILPLPRYKHDCERCRYLGQFYQFDLYCCPTATPFPTVIARYGNDEEAYTSGLALTKINPVLAYAAKLAIAKGLLTPSDLDNFL